MDAKPTIHRVIRTYVTTILNALELKEPIKPETIDNIVSLVFERGYSDAIKSKIAPEKQTEFAKSLTANGESENKEAFMEQIAELGGQDQINTQLINSANEVIAELIEKLKAQGDITAENLEKLQKFMSDPEAMKSYLASI